jgi:hypothetical protein
LNFTSPNENGTYTLTVQAGGQQLLVNGVGNENPDGVGGNLQVNVRVAAAGVDSTWVLQ